MNWRKHSKLPSYELVFEKEEEVSSILTKEYLIQGKKLNVQQAVGSGNILQILRVHYLPIFGKNRPEIMQSKRSLLEELVDSAI